MDEEFEKAQKSHCLWNKRQKRMKMELFMDNQPLDS